MARDTSLAAYISRVVSGALDGVDDRVFDYIYKHGNSSTDSTGKPMGVCPDQVRLALNIAQNTVSKSFSFLEHRDGVIYRVAVRPNITTGQPVGWFCAVSATGVCVSVRKNKHGRLYLLSKTTPAVLLGPHMDKEERDAALSKVTNPADWIRLRLKGSRIVLG